MKKKCMSKRLLSVVLIGTLASSNVVYAESLIQKDETVYVTLNQEGQVKERIVSDWVHSDDKNVEIHDKSILKDIKNIKGEEKPNSIGENLVWNLKENDVFYKGTTDKSLPIDVSIKYYLDGKEIAPKDLPGKSGEIKITVDYKNNESHMVEINGKERKIYTPFSTVTVVDLPMDNFKNVKINGGKMINDGNNQIVTFICLPGMKETLDIKDSKIDLKESLEITAQVENFEMGPIMITGTPELPDMGEFKNADSIDDLVKGIEDIQDASTKLVEGTGKLADGQKTLSEKMDLFTSGVDKLGAGALGLNDGMLKLAAGIDVAQNGSLQVAEGLKALSIGTAKFGDGAAKFGSGATEFATNSKNFAEGAVKLSEGTDKLVKGSKGLTEGANKLSEGTTKVAEKMDGLSQGLDKMVDSAGKLSDGQKQVVAGLTESLGSIEKLKQAKELELKGLSSSLARNERLQGLVNLLDKIPGTGDLTQKLNEDLGGQRKELEALKDSGTKFLQGLGGLQAGLTKLQVGSQNVNAGIEQLHQGEKTVADGSKELSKATKQISEKTGELAKGAEQISKGGEQLSPVADKLKKGSEGLYGGSDKLNTAAKTLTDGTKKLGENTEKLAVGSEKVANGLTKLKNQGVKPLSDGASKLNSAVGQLSDGASKLKEGVNKLADGSKELNDNMKKFDKEGIHKISDKVDEKVGDIEDLIDVKDEIVKLSDNYKTFSGLGDNMEGKVKFVMKTDEIKVKKVEVKEAKKVAEVKEEKKGFFAWVKSLFS